MGIRIHKMIGYGLIDVKTKNYGIIDERFSKKFVKTFYDNEWSLDKYKEWLVKQKFSEDEWEVGFEVSAVKDVEECDISRCFISETEYGEANVFLVIPPPNLNSDYRYDDLIDYYEENIKNDASNTPCKNWYKVLPHGFYPHHASFMDSRTGRKVQFFPPVWEDEMTEADAKKRKFKSIEEYKRYKVPWVPKGVELICRYAGVFKSKKTILQLRPMMYVYWG